MAKPKTEVLVEVTTNPIEQISIWINDAKTHLSDIASVEGVENMHLAGIARVRIAIDKRYDVKEIALELRELLTAKVPSVFREDDV